ncbi:hypothetical protein D3C77_560850 [compost metagenome]
MFKQAEVVRKRLGKAEARIEDDPFGINTHRRTRCHPLLKIARHFGGDIFVMRIVLHVARLAAHMHQAHRQAGCRCRIQGAITTKRANIVDQASA